MKVSDLKDSIAASLSGIDINNIADLNGGLEEAAREFVTKAKPPEVEGRQNIVLYNGVYDYNIDDSIFGTIVRDLKPQGIDRTPADTVRKTYEDRFDRNKQFVWNGFEIAFEYRNNTPIIRIATPKTIQRIVLDTMTQTTGWTASGVATGLVADSAVYYQIPASLRFNISGAGTATLTKTLTSNLDLTAYQGVGVGFLAFRASDVDALSSFNLKIGSDASNYYQVTTTQGFLGALDDDEFLLIAFDLATATQVGTPVITAMNYMQCNFTATEAQNNVRVGALWISLPYNATLLFQTSALFIPQGSTVPLKTITADNDTIALNDAGYAIYKHEATIATYLRSGGSLESATVIGINQKLYGVRARNGAIIQMGLYDHYRGDNPDEGLRTVGNYYLGD